LFKFKGTGFSTEASSNSIYFGTTNACTVLESTTETIICQIDYRSKLIPNLLYDIEIQVDNLGNAIPNDNFKFGLQSFISSISPDIGNIRDFSQLFKNKK
jgi:hypothetical protein